MTKKPAPAKKTPAVKGKSGPPSTFKPEYVEQATKLCQMGATDADLANFFKVAERTIYRWAGTKPEFAAALKVGKEVADDRVERSLYHRACGYSHPEVHVSNYQGEITLTPITKHYPPDTGAGIFWLKNRRGWRDKVDLEHGGHINHSNLSEAEIDARLAELQAKLKGETEA